MSQLCKRIIGLTGGIATGKTSVSSYIKRHFSIPVLDADAYARNEIRLNSTLSKLIKQRYGKSIYLENGDLDYQRLGNIIFYDVKQKEWLENKIHPYVKQIFITEIKKSKSRTLILDLPLLFESKLTFLVTEIWIVYCNEQEQLKRLMKRNSLNKKDGIIRMKNQLPFKDKVKTADCILDNSSTFENLYIQINEVIRKTDLY